MQAQIENLVKLQGVDLERARLTLAIRALPAEIAEGAAALHAAERHSADTSDAISREESLRTRLDRDVASHRQKIARFRTQLDSVKTPEQAAAIDHEITFSSSEVDRLEAEELASLERTEALEAARAEARVSVESLAAALEKIRARAAVRQKEFNAELATLNIERDAIRPLIEADFLMRYDRLSVSRGTGIARVGQSAVHRLPHGRASANVESASRRPAAHCDSCGRLLYWDPAMAPAPSSHSAAASAPTPAARPRVRKANPAGALRRSCSASAWIWMR